VDTTTRLIFDVTGDDDANSVRPTWSPDGRQIAFASDRLAGQYDIYVMDLELTETGTLVPSGLTPVNITNNGVANDNDPTWSPDGGDIAFVSNSSGREQIYVLDVSQCLYVGLEGCNSDNARRLTFFNERNIDPAWPLLG
jgi:dipeptidyl aminopeptidase/acylaminoacyl peptidase